MAQQFSLVAEIIAKTDSFTKAINDVGKKTDSLAKNFAAKTKSIGEGFTKVGTSLTKSITMPAVAAGTALAGITLAKGFSRLVGIDTARAKLTGLGHDAKGVEAIMTSALDAVRGTSFGMDEAATTAANAVAAGVNTGKELTRYLSLTGDAAAIAGSSMSEMGSILNKVTTSNKAYNGELQQLSDRGLPVYQWLAKEAGVTSDAVFKMASEGKISSEMLMNAIENNIGGAAKTFGEESFTAGIANMWAAVGRLGASFLDAGGKGGGFFSTIKENIPKVIEYIDGMGAKAEQAGEKFGAMVGGFIDKIKDIKQWFDNLDPSIQEIIKKVTLFGSLGAIAIGPILLIVGKLMTAISALSPIFSVLGTVIGAIASPIGLIVAGIAALVAGFILAYNHSETFRNGVNAVFSTVKEIVLNLFGATVAFFQEKVQIIKDFWAENGAQIQEAFSNVFNAIKAVVDFLMPAIEFVIKMVMDNVKGVINGALNTILGLIKVFASLFTGDWKGLWEGTKQLLSGALEFIWNLANLMMMGRILTIFKSFGTGSINLFKNMWSSITGFFKGLGDDAIRISENLVSGVINYFKNLLSNATSIFNLVKSAMTNPIETARNVISAVISAIKGFFTNLSLKFPELSVNPFTKARDLISGVIDKIKGFFSGLSLSFPSIKMPKLPRFTLTGSFSLNPPSVPKIGLQWFAKGGLMLNPTVFGMNGNNLMVGGEAGAEAILPLTKPILGTIADKIFANMEALSTGTTNNQDVNINNEFVFNVDGNMSDQEMKKIANYVAKAQLTGLKRLGK
ncbi:tape measure protein [Bacillus sp. FJAT-50079]|uniref:phage tail protein n=1 Tax=Bacillus sp. FJAT-50079 TaxID=2833577 RepID=UPI001BCA4932|nr:tape measure protein [Bacillus sp. FJAT-50079]MBS4207441.1 tape measure protein [Bacillus sp. FJAT-50079]